MKLATALVPLIVLLGSAACHAAVTYPFIETDREDPDWVVASSRLILTDGRSIPDWYDDPEDPAFPWLVHFWKFEGDKQDGRAVPMQSTFGGGLNGIYVREGFDLYLYDDGNTDQPYLGNDACGFEHAAILEGPYFASPCDLLHNPSNPDPNNFAARTFFSSKSIGALGRDGLIVAPRRVIILDIDGLRRDAFYSMISRWTGRIPNLASVILGKRANGGDFNGLVRTNALWTGKDDMQADGDTDFSRSFQSVGVNYAVTVLPSYTFACQATLFTGVAPAAHGILGNEWFNRFAGNFNDAHNFRRGYSGGSARSVNQITRNYEWSFIGGKEQESACTATLVALAAGDFGWGGLCSTDLQFPTVYQQLSDDYDLSSVIGFNMYLEDTNYHADPNIHWARPSDDDLCTYNEDDTGKLYDRSMINTTLAYLRRLRQQEEPFPDVVTVYFAGHDHNMHMLGNNQTAYLQSTVDPEFGRFLKGISPWVDPRNFLYAISTDHGHTQLKHDSEHSIIVEDELEEVLWDMTPRYDCFDNIFEEEFTAYVALNGGMARAYNDYMYNVLKSLGVVDLYKENEDIKDEDLTAEYICDNIWIVGSPDTVTRKLRKLYDDTGGFGTVLQVQYVYEPFQDWLNNMTLFAKEVMPNLADLVPEDEDSAAAAQ